MTGWLEGRPAPWVLGRAAVALCFPSGYFKTMFYLFAYKEFLPFFFFENVI